MPPVQTLSTHVSSRWCAENVMDSQQGPGGEAYPTLDVPSKLRWSERRGGCPDLGLGTGGQAMGDVEV